MAVVLWRGLCALPITAAHLLAMNSPMAYLLKPLNFTGETSLRSRLRYQKGRRK